MPPSTPMLPNAMTFDDPCQIALQVEVGPAARRQIEAALGMASVEAVVLTPVSGKALSAGEVKPLVDLLQKAGVAVLVADDAKLARTVRADGVHLTWRGPRGNAGIAETNDQPAASEDPAHDAEIEKRIAEIKDAREILGARGIIGVAAANTRHAAMEVGEQQVDYVAFGGLDADTRSAFVNWWAEIFEVPCVAGDIVTADEAQEAAEAGADFVSLRIGADEPAEAVAERIGRIADALST